MAIDEKRKAVKPLSAGAAKAKARATSNAAKIAKARAEAKKKIARKQKVILIKQKAAAKRLKAGAKKTGSYAAGVFIGQKDSKIIAEHTVKKGDTLGKIAKKYYGSATKPYWELIQEANNIKDANLIYPDQVFKIPALPKELK